MALNYFIM